MKSAGGVALRDQQGLAGGASAGLSLDTQEAVRRAQAAQQRQLHQHQHYYDKHRASAEGPHHPHHDRGGSSHAGPPGHNFTCAD